jgi:hypothetical protein
MTEEIIIDGVNVAGCDGLNKNSLPLKQCDLLQFKTKDGGIAGRWCTDHSNCYYKQLKRLEFELKRYKDMEKQGLEEFKDIGGCWGCGLKLQLEQDLKDMNELKQENVRLFNESIELRAKNIEYKSALEEIRGIVTSAFAKQRPYKEDFFEKKKIETKDCLKLSQKEILILLNKLLIRLLKLV